MKMPLIVFVAAVALVGCATKSGPGYVAERQSPAETEAMIRDSNRFPQPNRPDTFSQSYDPGVRNSHVGGGYTTYGPVEFSHGHWVGGWGGAGNWRGGWGGWNRSYRYY